MAWRSLFIFTLIIIAIKQFLWTAAVPIFHTPDEQAHFAQIQWIVENNNFQVHSGENLSVELATAEKLLGVYRDSQGNNKFTYHPEYNIPYSKTTTGLYEKKIQTLPKSDRTKYVGAEAAGYPPLYYALTSPIYKSVYDAGLIDRLFALRATGLVLIIILAAVSWKTGELVFQSKKAAAALTILVGFQPMVSFVAAGYHPDNLLNIFSSLLLLVCLLVIKHGFKWKYFLAVLFLIYLGLETKQFMFFAAPAAGAICVYAFFKNKYLKWLAFLAVLAAPAIAFLLLLPIPNMPNVTPESPLFNLTLLNYLKFRIPRFFYEMLPWFWFVFKWLGVTLDPAVLKLVTRIEALALIGLVIGLIKKRDKYIFFLLVVVISYACYMFLWDWRLMQSRGFSIGLQGRYLLPPIVAEMALLLYGLTNLVPTKFKQYAFFLVAFGMILLNINALNRLLTSYYDSVTQASQYKPELIKQALQPITNLKL